MKTKQAIEIVDSLMERSKPGSPDTIEGIFSHDEREAMATLLDLGMETEEYQKNEGKPRA